MIPPHNVQCPQCGSEMAYCSAAAGMAVKCPSCRTVFRMPGMQDPPPMVSLGPAEPLSPVSQGSTWPHGLVISIPVVVAVCIVWLAVRPSRQERNDIHQQPAHNALALPETVIPGMMPVDVYGNLVNRGFRKDGPRQVPESGGGGVLWYCTSVTVDFDYCIATITFPV